MGLEFTAWVWAAAAVVVATAAPDPGADAFLTRWAGLSAGERREVESGHVVVRTLPIVDQKDVAGIAVVKVQASKAFLRARLRDPESVGGASVLASGEIADPPRPEDVASLRFDAGQFDEVRNCRIGDCALKLPPGEIERIARETAGRIRPTEAAALLRELLLRTAASYRRLGDAGLGTYADSQEEVAVRDALRRLLASPPQLLVEPDLARRLEELPGGLGGRLVWTKERLWKRTVVSLDHELVLDSGGDDVFVAKRLFASHYFEAALTVIALHEGEDGCYVVFLNRSRSDVGGNGFSRLERALVNVLLRRRLRGQWEDARTRFEAAYRAQARAGAAGTP